MFDRACPMQITCIDFFRNNSTSKFEIQLCPLRYALRCYNMSEGWKSLISWPTSLDKHIKRINEILRAWRTCKLRDLNNGWTDKTGIAIYPTVFPPSSRLSHGFLLPSVRHVSSWFSTAQPIQFLKRRPLCVSRDQHCVWFIRACSVWFERWNERDHHAFTQIWLI